MAVRPAGNTTQIGGNVNMQKTSLTPEGKRHATDYLSYAMERLSDIEQRAAQTSEVEGLQLRLSNVLQKLEKVRLLLYIEFGPEIPSDAITVDHSAPEELAF